MPAVWRIRDRRTFEELRRQGRRSRRGPVTVTWLPGPASEPCRVAFAVGRGVGPAVVRNRVRRRLRAITRSLAAELPSGALLVAARPEAGAKSYEELRDDVREAVSSLPAEPARGDRR